MKKIWFGIIILFFIFGFIFIKQKTSQPKKLIYIQVRWNSMYPTLKNGKKYLAEKIKSWKVLKHQDIVVFKLYNTEKYYVKKLWIMPNDKFKLNFLSWNKILQIVVNDKYKINVANYKNSLMYKMLLVWSKKTNKWKVYTNQCWVFWDNVKVSIDSKKFWFISCQRIKYRLIKK